MNAINTTRKAFSVIRMLSARNFSQNQVLRKEEKPSGNFKRLKANQKKFQKDDGVPVFLKAGARDKILYQLSLIGTLVGVGLSIHTFAIIALG